MKTLTKLIISLFVVFALHITLYTLHSEAAVPHLINYQGRLTDASGSPLNGSYSITFRLYDAETAGTLLWGETQSVTIQKGIFSVILGGVTSLNLAFDKQYFLEIKVGAEVMTPRQRLTSAGYAIRAEKAEGAENAQNANTVANVGVSTTPQANKILPLDNNAKLPSSILSSLPFKVYDSGWFAVSQNNTYTKTHNLGTLKVGWTFYFSPNNNNTQVFLADTAVDNGYNEEDGVTIRNITTTDITIRTGGYTLFMAYPEGRYSSGYFRIIGVALE